MPESEHPSPTDQDLALARAALLDITTADTIGEPAGSITEDDGSLTVYFDTTMAGYPGWKWTVSLAHVTGLGPSVLETELTPGEGALLSPDWVPWSERLAEYKETQAELAAHEFDDDDSDDEDDDFDDEDVINDDEALLHSGDLDGVDIDSLDDSDVDMPVVETPAEVAAPVAKRSRRARSDSALAQVDDHEAEKAEGQADDAGPQPPVKSRRVQRTKKQQQGDEGE